MDMIFHGINEHRRTFQFLQHGRHVGVKGIPDSFMQDRLAVFSAKNKMNVETGERLGHF
jgi:hypothetical protein